MERFTAGLRRAPAAQSGGSLFRLDPPAGRGERRLGRLRPRRGDGPGQHVRQRRRELLRPASRPRNDGGDRLRGLPGHVDRLCEVPRPPARKVDQRPILRLRQSVRPGSRQGLGRRLPQRRREPHDLRRRRRRSDPAPHRRSPTAGPAGRRRRPRGLHRRPPRIAGRLADGPREPVLQPGDRQSRVGTLSGRRIGRRRGRPPHHQPAQQPGADGRARASFWWRTITTSNA